MDLDLSIRILLYRSRDWDQSKDIISEMNCFSRFVILRSLQDNLCVETIKVLKSLSDLEFYNLIFEYME